MSHYHRAMSAYPLLLLELRLWTMRHNALTALVGATDCLLHLQSLETWKPRLACHPYLSNPNVSDMHLPTVLLEFPVAIIEGADLTGL